MIDLRTATNFLGVAAAVLWLLSSIAWFWSLSVKLDLGKPAANDQIGISISTNADGSGDFKVNGMDVPTFQKILAYQKASFYRNATASLLSGVAAVCAGSAAY